MIKNLCGLIPLIALLILHPDLAYANSGDFSGAVAIGTGYAGIDPAPTNGLIVQGNVGIATTLPQSEVHVYNGEVQVGSSGANCTSANAGAIRYYTGSLFYCNGSNWLSANACSGGSGMVSSGTQYQMGYYATTGNTISGDSTITTDANNDLIINSGALAIGTATPSNKLDIGGAVAIGTSYAGIKTAPLNGLIVQGNVGIGTASPQYPLHFVGIGSDVVDIYATDQSSGYFYFETIPNGASGTGSTDLVMGAGASSGSNAGAYEGLMGNFESVLTLYTANNPSGQRAMRIGNENNNGCTDCFAIQSMNDAQTSVTATPFKIANNAPNNSFAINSSGNVVLGAFAGAASTTVCQNSGALSTCSSAFRYKENVEPSPLGLKEVLKMRPIVFDFKNHKNNWEKHDFGFVAEDMEKINPLFVTYNKDGVIEGVRYMQLTAVNAKAIQELYAIIERQQNEIDELKGAVKQLTGRATQ
jgi:Chaperone of endosialidase